ncbi:class I SAM-dependent methyltransferase [Nonomuraea soli]|uniref:Trans-aconitate methyltransferase n=1 Tax=Nonomuraea soli TaxID=1032476 RepID=A0A7W0CNA2_9ACTN|nr:class I SAM-dependent methyltransferase [Nonomuraea soli]MBA2894334.1 trans-aconitate methyltransferase [Nonomuraea soli]
MEHLFGGAAPYYARYRLSHGDAAIAHLARTFGPAATVLDLGSGPGTIAVPLACHVARVLAADPDEEMLQEGAKAGVANIRWIKADSTMLRQLPPFDHVVMGRSFHWMDRLAVLADLDDLLPPGGVIALVGPTREAHHQEWHPVAQRVCEEFGLTRHQARGSYQDTGLHHDDVLETSPFARLERVTSERTVVWDVDSVIGYQLSLSISTPARLGERREEFLTALRRAVEQAHPEGTWSVPYTTEVLVARRTQE